MRQLRRKNLNLESPNFQPGDVVVGRVFKIEPEGALIDIGIDTAAFIPLREMSLAKIESPEEVLQLNQTREFGVISNTDKDGNPTLWLSIRYIEEKIAWERVRQMQAENVTVRSVVFATNLHYAFVRIEGLRGSIPKFQICSNKPLEKLVEEEFPLKLVEVDEDRNRLVLSHQLVLYPDGIKKYLEVGQIVNGRVRAVKPYGAFIEIVFLSIGVKSALLRITEISHDHIDTPHHVLRVDDEVKAIIIDLDISLGRISVSTKQLEPEPGDMLKNPQRVYEKAEEMAAKYRQQLASQSPTD